MFIGGLSRIRSTSLSYNEHEQIYTETQQVREGEKSASRFSPSRQPNNNLEPMQGARYNHVSVIVSSSKWPLVPLPTAMPNTFQARDGASWLDSYADAVGITVQYRTSTMDKAAPAWLARHGRILGKKLSATFFCSTVPSFEQAERAKMSLITRCWNTVENPTVSAYSINTCCTKWSQTSSFQSTSSSTLYRLIHSRPAATHAAHPLHLRILAESSAFHAVMATPVLLRIWLSKSHCHLPQTETSSTSSCFLPNTP